MTTNLIKPNLTNLYEKDYHEWLQYNLKLLENKQFNEVDLVHIIEELASLGRS